MDFSQALVVFFSFSSFAPLIPHGCRHVSNFVAKLRGKESKLQVTSGCLYNKTTKNLFNKLAVYFMAGPSIINIKYEIQITAYTPRHSGCVLLDSAP